MKAKAVVVKVGVVAVIALAGLTTFDPAESFADGPIYITPDRMEQFEDASQRWSLRVNQFGNIGGALWGTAGAAGCGALGVVAAANGTVIALPTAGQSLVAAGALAGACGYWIPEKSYEAGQFLGGKLGELWTLPSQHSLERQFGVMPDPKFGPVMIIGGDDAAWGGSLR